METDTLAAILPIWNIPDHLSNSLRELGKLGIFSEIIVSDDGSEENCNPFDLDFSSENLDVELKYVRSDTNLGAGHARNVALKEVTSDHVLFFDADDRPLPGLRMIWDEHRSGTATGRPLDFTIFRHADSRVLAESGQFASFPVDESVWAHVLGGLDQRELDLFSRANLCGISAYPWNKIYRTDFLRENNIVCSETPVHNDIKLHWHSFLAAENVLAMAQFGVEHVVAPHNALDEDGRDHHLTNRGGKDRLCIFDILDDVRGKICQSRNRVLFQRQFLHFTHGVLNWGLDRMVPALRPVFAAKMRAEYLAISSEEFAIYADWQPESAERIVDFLQRGSA